MEWQPLILLHEWNWINRRTKQTVINFKLRKNDNILKYLLLTVSACKHMKLSDSLQADLEAAAEEAGTDVDTLRNKVWIFISLLASIYLFSILYNSTFLLTHTPNSWVS